MPRLRNGGFSTAGGGKWSGLIAARILHSVTLCWQAVSTHSYLNTVSAAEATITELPSKPQPDTRSRKLVVDFYKLLAQHCKQHRDVAFYANALCITTTYLYKVCRKVLGFSPKEEIDQLTVFEIKSYLAHTDLPIKRIAEELHFEDASYMCRYFRRLTGVSPADYRNEQTRL